jgi:AraC-like DNA-binding protein
MKILTKGTYYGEKKLELDNKGIVLSEYNYHLPETGQHYHENPYFMYVLQGNVKDINKKGTSLCPSGTFLLHNWNEQHSNTKESSIARGFHIEFERKWFEQNKLDVDLWEGSRVLENPTLHHLLAKLYFEFKCQDSFSESTIDLLLLQLCEATQSSNIVNHNKQPSWIPKLQDILHENNEDISLQSLSETLGVHPVHLSRAVPKYLKTTLGDYIRRQKIKRAFGLLTSTTFSLTEITYICGFSDQSHFTKTFKMYFQKTPKEFRVQLGQC